ETSLVLPRSASLPLTVFRCTKQVIPHLRREKARCSRASYHPFRMKASPQMPRAGVTPWFFHDRGTSMAASSVVKRFAQVIRSLCNDRKLGRRSARMTRMPLRVEELERRVVPTLLGQSLFPADYPTNNSILNAPVSANSSTWISAMAASRNHLIV